MSIRVMSQVWDSDLTDIYEVTVLLVLANHADDNGRCYPGMERVAKLARCSLRKAQAVTKELAKRGYLTVERNSEPRGCNMYFLTLPPVQDAPQHSVQPRTPRQVPPHVKTNPPAQRAPEPSKKHKRNSARATDLPNERQSGALAVMEGFARAIREGHSSIGRHCPVPTALQLIEAGAITTDQCRSVGVPI